MRPKSSQTLRGRLVIAFGLLGFLLSTVFAVGVHFAFESIEHDLLVDMLERELESVRQGGTIVSAAGSAIRIEYYVSDATSTPEVYRNLAPGFHEIGSNEHERHVLVKNVEGVRHMVVFQDENIERREEALMWTLVISVLIATYLSIWLGFVISRRVISPVTALAGEIRQLEYAAAPADALRTYAQDEVGELAEAFRDYRRRLQEFIVREQAFTGTVSHELRTPLTVIGSNIDVLLQDARLASAARERLLRMRRAVRASADLINALLNIARRENGSPAECEPRAIIDAAARDAAEQFGVNAVVELAADAPAILRSPAAIFAAVVRNLLHNAIEHGRQPVTVRLARDRLTIADAGSGPAAAEKEGRLGLDIVQRLCEGQGWRLDVSIGASATQACVHFPGG
jgi:signal transduction histidine kinase